MVKHVFAFWGVNSLHWGKRKNKNVGLYVEMWSDDIPWQLSALHPSGRTLFLCEGELLSRDTRDKINENGHQDRFYYLAARTCKPLNTSPKREEDPNIIYIRRDSYQHLARWAKAHGYNPATSDRVNRGTPRSSENPDDLPDLREFTDNPDPREDDPDAD